jgi:hypothetical protein
MRKIVLITSILLMFAGLAAAQIPTAGNVFLGYSYYNTDLSSIGRTGTNGFVGSLEGKIIPWVGIVADISTHYGSQDFVGTCPGGGCTVNFNVSESNVLFGPRVSVGIGKFRPFAEAMFGVGHVNANGFGSDTSFATAIGGGLDYRIIRPIAWRFQGDYLQTRFFGTTQNNVRLATGIVFRF